MPNGHSAKKKAGAHKAQKPLDVFNQMESGQPRTIDSLVIKRVNQSDLYQRQNDDQKKTLQELAESQEVFYIFDVKLITTRFGENYMFRCVGKTLGKFIFWAQRDKSRDIIYELISREIRDAEAIGPFCVEQLEPRQKGMNGYCKITVFDDLPFG